MGLLDEIIDGAVSDVASTASLLRRVQVVAHRLEAAEIKAWAQDELRGYTGTESLPHYRSGLAVNVWGVWAGPGFTRLPQPLSQGAIPSDERDLLFRVNFVQPLAELEKYASAADDAEMGIPWDPFHVTQYNKWASQGLVPYMEFMSLLSANRVVTPAMLRGVIDSVRNVALNFALNLQSASPEAGAISGPTVSDDSVAQAVWNVTTNIYGDGTQVAHGTDIKQRATVKKGDLASLLQAAGDIGISSEGKEELARSVLDRPEKRSSRLQSLLSRVREGAFLVGTGVTADVVASQLSDLIAGYLA